MDGCMGDEREASQSPRPVRLRYPCKCDQPLFAAAPPLPPPFHPPPIGPSLLPPSSLHGSPTPSSCGSALLKPRIAPVLPDAFLLAVRAHKRDNHAFPPTWSSLSSGVSRSSEFGDVGLQESFIPVESLASSHTSLDFLSSCLASQVERRGNPFGSKTARNSTGVVPARCPPSWPAQEVSPCPQEVVVLLMSCTRYVTAVVVRPENFLTAELQQPPKGARCGGKSRDGMAFNEPPQCGTR